MTVKAQIDSTHECPAPGCRHRIEIEHFACPTHWYRIPLTLRVRLWIVYREQFGRDEYFQARADCLRALQVPEAEIADVNAGVV